MANNNTLLTGIERDEYIAQRFDEAKVKMTKIREDFVAWYDAKDEDTQALIDEISDRTYYITDESEYDEFINMLADYGINDASEFEDAFDGEWEGFGERVYANFSEELMDNCGYNIEPDFIRNCIDWVQVWYSALRYDYNTCEYNGNTYFFRNI